MTQSQDQVLRNNWDNIQSYASNLSKVDEILSHTNIWDSSNLRQKSSVSISSGKVAKNSPRIHTNQLTLADKSNLKLTEQTHQNSKDFHNVIRSDLQYLEK